jgi:hypothetical protein
VQAIGDPCRVCGGWHGRQKTVERPQPAHPQAARHHGSCRRYPQACGAHRPQAAASQPGPRPEVGVGHGGDRRQLGGGRANLVLRLGAATASIAARLIGATAPKRVRSSGRSPSAVEVAAAAPNAAARLGTCSLGQSWKRWSGPVSNSCTARLLGRMLTDLLTRPSTNRRDRAVRAGIGKRRSSCSGTPQRTRGNAAGRARRG